MANQLSKPSKVKTVIVVATAIVLAFVAGFFFFEQCGEKEQGPHEKEKPTRDKQTLSDKQTVSNNEAHSNDEAPIDNEALSNNQTAQVEIETEAPPTPQKIPKYKCEKHHAFLDGECVFQDVKQPGSKRWWRRCPMGQKWNGSVCVGTKIKATWKKAKKSCARGYRLPSKSHYDGIFIGQKYKTMFLPSKDSYWSSTAQEKGRAWLGSFIFGYVLDNAAGGHYYVRCVR